MSSSPTVLRAITNFVFGDGSDQVLTAAVIDELRVADNSDGMGFANVANNTLAYQPPVPEPASLSLVGLRSVCSRSVARGARRSLKPRQCGE